MTQSLTKGHCRCFPVNIAKFLKTPILKTSVNGCFWKSAPQRQIYRREVIPEFYYSFKHFTILNFAMMEWFCYVTCFAKVFLLLFFFSLKHDIFITKKLFYNTSQVRYYHFFIVEINVKSVNLIQTSKLNRKLLSPWWRTIRFL